MHLKKFLLFGLMAAVLPAFAEEAADRKNATSLKYVEHELDTRQNKFTAESNKAMEYTDSAGTVQKRAVTSDLGTSTTDTSLPMVGGVNTKLDTKQDDIAAINDHTAVTYTGTTGKIGAKGIYQATESYVAQSNNLIDAKTFNAALKNGLDREFVCREDNLDPVSGLCWLYTIHNNTEYVSATGTGVQNGTPTPTNPIYPVFYRQGDMVLRKVGDYADSYDATTHKITRNVGVKVLDGTENWIKSGTYNGAVYLAPAESYWVTNNALLCTHFRCVTTASASTYFQGDMLINNGYLSLWYDNNGTTAIANTKAFLADQYAAGTPVTVYYPLATPVEEDWTETTYNENVYIPQNQ